MKKTIILLVAIFGVTLMNAQDLNAYKIYNAKGKKVSYSKMLKSLDQADMILFGELHNNAISHWLQYEMTNDFAQNNKLTLGAEMFEADNQEVLSRYLSGDITEEGLDSLARLWKNYKTDYKPLVEIAKTNNFEFIATNIPRKYASMVYKGGFEALDTVSDINKAFIAPLPIDYDAELDCYKNILAMSHGHGGANLPKAQAVKDATMAYFIMKNYNPESTFIHYNGSYHSDNYQSILWYLKKANSELNYMTITTVSQENVHKLLEENKGVADFIIVVDEDMTTTY